MAAGTLSPTEPTLEPVPSRARRWIGRGLTFLLILFLLADGLGKVLCLQPVLEASASLEIPERVIPGLGITLIVATLLYAFRQTSFLGAILLTGYLGGATWTHVRMGGPLFPIIFPPMMGSLLWAGLMMRYPQVHECVSTAMDVSPDHHPDPI
jgi:hypothetical protein